MTGVESYAAGSQFSACHLASSWNLAGSVRGYLVFSGVRNYSWVVRRFVSFAVIREENPGYHGLSDKTTRDWVGAR